MLKRIAAMLLCLTVGICFAACQTGTDMAAQSQPSLVIFDEDETTAPPTESETAADSLTETVTESDSLTESESASETQDTEPAATTASASDLPGTTTLPEDEPLPASLDKEGSYTSPEDVADYIHTFGTLPPNFLTKKAAQKLGWNSSEGNLWDVAPGMSIGGDTFGNREGLLPDGSYHECDVNYTGGYRGAERLIYADDGRIYYTNDHYRSFTQLY